MDKEKLHELRKRAIEDGIQETWDMIRALRFVYPTMRMLGLLASAIIVAMYIILSMEDRPGDASMLLSGAAFGWMSGLAWEMRLWMKGKLGRIILTGDEVLKDYDEQEKKTEDE